jgi:hypothetical protein
MDHVAGVQVLNTSNFPDDGGAVGRAIRNPKNTYSPVPVISHEAPHTRGFSFGSPENPEHRRLPGGAG